jgi:branched-chain amino acid transport system ATP-binding protein
LAPVIVSQIGEVLGTIKGKGITVLLVEQNFRFAAHVSDRHYVMESGKIIDMITRSELQKKMHRLEQYLGI